MFHIHSFLSKLFDNAKKHRLELLHLSTPLKTTVHSQSLWKFQEGIKYYQLYIFGATIYSDAIFHYAKCSLNSGIATQIWK